MRTYRATFWIVLLCYLARDIVRAESNGTTKSTTAVTNDAKSKPEKRDSYRHEGTPTESRNRPQKISNDEPFRPIYRPAYTPHRQAIVSQTETYYDKPKLMDVVRYVAPGHNGGVSGSSGATPPAHSAAPLIGSYLSSSIGGVRYASDAYRGPYSPAVLELKPQQQQQPPPPLAAVQKPSSVKVASATQKVKGSTNNSAYVQPVTSFLFERTSKPFHQNDDDQYSQQLKQQQQHQPQPHQQRLILRPLNQHQQQEPQPNFQFYNPHQQEHQQQQQHLHQHPHQSLHHAQLNARVRPQQQHFQYIIAIPLSYARQLQHQLATGSTEATLRHEVPLSALKSEYTDVAHTVIGPLAREHYGSYQPVHYTSNYQAQHASPTAPAAPAAAAQHHGNSNQPAKPQYTTQYIQIPASVLNAALQAQYPSADYQNRRLEQEQSKALFTPSTTNHQSQVHGPPQLAYNINNYLAQQQHQIPNHSPVYVHQLQHQAQGKPQTQEKALQQAIIQVEGAKPSAKSTPTKTYLLDNTQIPSSPSTATAPFKAPPSAAAASSSSSSSSSPETLPIVHYNPIYVQGPPTEQQSLFGGGGTFNYHRFATGGFHAPPPVPIVRLSATPSQHFYNSLPQYHQHPYHHQQQQQQQHHQHYHHSQPQLQLQSVQPHLPYRMALEHKTIFGGYTPEQIPSITEGLPYFTHPGGVHYGTHLYHHTPAFLASPSIAAKATETVNGSSVGNQHQLEQQQQQQQQQHHHQQSFHPRYEASISDFASSPSVNVAASDGVSLRTADGSAASSPLVKYP